MPCFHPHRVALDENGHLDWSVWNPVPDLHELVMVACRRCVGCKSGEAREWAIRCYHEALGHSRVWRDPVTKVATEIPNNVMITLTYDDEHLPEDGLLKLLDWQMFMKRLRNRREHAVRYFMCGEYGGLTGRCHFHAILFAEDFSDRYQVSGPGEQPVFCSYELDEIWGRGRATVDPVNLQTVSYVAGYVAKKSHQDGNFTGPLVEAIDEVTGEMRVVALEPEFRTMSKKPGLGRKWFDLNLEEIYPADKVVIGEQEFPPPGAYDRWLKKERPDLYVEVQAGRRQKRIDAQLEWTPQRCASAEEIKLANRMRKDSL